MKLGCLLYWTFLLEYGFMAPYEVWWLRKSKIELALELGSGIPNHFQSNRLRIGYYMKPDMLVSSTKIFCTEGEAH